MYGMMHRAIRQMVLDDAGPQAWAAIEQANGIGPADLVSAAVYPDAMTVGMLEAAAAQLGLDMAACLRRFGRYWVTFAAQGPYSGLMAFAGGDLPGFIANLDRMHQAVLRAMPEATVPGFTLLQGDGPALLVRYRSTRAGLEPMVTGLLEGLLHHFGEEGTVTHLGADEEGANFEIRRGGGAAA